MALRGFVTTEALGGGGGVGADGDAGHLFGLAQQPPAAGTMVSVDGRERLDRVCVDVLDSRTLRCLPKTLVGSLGLGGLGTLAVFIGRSERVFLNVHGELDRLAGGEQRAGADDGSEHERKREFGKSDQASEEFAFRASPNHEKELDDQVAEDAKHAHIAEQSIKSADGFERGIGAMWHRVFAPLEPSTCRVVAMPGERVLVSTWACRVDFGRIRVIQAEFGFRKRLHRRTFCLYRREREFVFAIGGRRDLVLSLRHEGLVVDGRVGAQVISGAQALRQTHRPVFVAASGANHRIVGSESRRNRFEGTLARTASRQPIHLVVCCSARGHRGLGRQTFFGFCRLMIDEKAL